MPATTIRFRNRFTAGLLLLVTLGLLTGTTRTTVIDQSYFTYYPINVSTVLLSNGSGTYGAAQTFTVGANG